MTSVAILLTHFQQQRLVFTFLSQTTLHISERSMFKCEEKGVNGCDGERGRSFLTGLRYRYFAHREGGGEGASCVSNCVKWL